MDDQQTDVLTLERVLGTLRRRLWLIVACTVLVAAAALVVSLLQTKKYTATAQLLFRDPGIADQAAGLQTPADTAPERTGATNIQLVTLGDVATKAGAKVGLTAHQVKGAITVAGQGQADIAAVSATWTSPAKAAQIANAFSRAFIANRRQVARQNVRSAIQLVQRQLSSMTASQRGGSQGQALQDRLESLRVLSSLQTGNVELAQPASVPSSASSPHTRRNTLLGLVVGLVLGIGLAFLLERLDRRMRDPDEAAAVLGKPLLGVIPRSDELSHATLAGSNGDLRSVLQQGGDIEAFRMLRAHLRYFTIGRELRTLLVTSAAAGEGKTTVALNLARAAAMTSESTLLIEADLRRPSIARSLGLRTRGLADLLVSDRGMEDALREFTHTVAVEVRTPGTPEGQTASLDVLVAGAIPPNPAQLLESRQMSLLLAAARDRYQTVIVDTPPVSVVSDAIPLIEEVDGVIVVSRVGASTLDACRHLRDRLEHLGAPVLGIVANDVEPGHLAGYGYAYDAYDTPREAETPVHFVE